MLVEQFNASIYLQAGNTNDYMTYSIGPFATYDEAKVEIEKIAQADPDFTYGIINKVFVWQVV